MKVSWTCDRQTIAIIAPRDKRADYKQVVDLADKKHGGFVTVTIETPRKPRTTGDGSQSHHINGHIQQIAQETGNPFEVIKLEVKYRAIGMGYPILYRPDGQPQRDLWGREMGISEADSSTSDCAILIEASHIIASELGIILQEN